VLFDHVEIRVADLAASERFYLTVLDTLGVAQTSSDADLAEWDDFGISPASADDPVTRRLHVAWLAPSREHVDAFWRAGTAAGYRDDGAPGERPVYHPGCYGAFVLDPDGNNVEVVNHNRG
jgi:catechol 2,3-dioxygenase-like lactoylglutathione lyase family enzyme